MTHRGRIWLLDVVMAAMVLAFVLLVAGACRAADCDRYYALGAGMTAPCEGVLMSPEEAARVLLLEDALDIAKAELLAEQGRRKTDGDESKALLAIERKARAECERDKAPPPEPERAWYDSPWVGAAIGTAVGVGAALAVAFAVR